MADERQSDLSVVFVVCPQNRKHSYDLKIFVSFRHRGAQSENDNEKKTAPGLPSLA